jgi:hypothetical protein
VSNAFFTALGRTFLRKQAMRVPWPHLVQMLRKKELLPGAVPTLPFLEPDPEPEPEVIPVPVAVPVPTEKEEPEEKLAPEQRPKPKSEGEQASAEHETLG